jgi:lipoprotein-anchoring transpeptidase ErfK/SrfK
MKSRSIAEVVIYATIGCSIVVLNGAAAQAQYYSQDRYYQERYYQDRYNQERYYQDRSYQDRYYQERDANPFSQLFSGYPRSPIPRTTVAFPPQYRPGTIVIDTSARRLYLVTAPGQAFSYGIGVGRDGFRWSGTHYVSAKREWPDWTPPSEMLRRRPDLPRHMVGGIDNPLGARALYLGSTLYRIHGSNEPETIGQAVSSGCIRMTNDDVIDLYDRVPVGAKVVVLN